MQRLEGTDKVLVLSFYTDFMDFMDLQFFTVSLHILSFFTTRHKNNLNIYLPKINCTWFFFWCFRILNFRFRINLHSFSSTLVSSLCMVSRKHRYLAIFDFWCFYCCCFVVVFFAGFGANLETLLQGIWLNRTINIYKIISWDCHESRNVIHVNITLCEKDRSICFCYK